MLKTVKIFVYKIDALSLFLCFPGSLAGSCNFNKPEDQWEAACQLVQDQDDDFDWQIGHGRKYQGTGPSTDHSAGRWYDYRKLKMKNKNVCILTK